jgi:hypothetical protein
VILVVCLSPAYASNPGEPLDCSDWVFLEPGFSCSNRIPYPCESTFDPLLGSDDGFCGYRNLSDMAVDNTGTMYRLRRGAAIDESGNPLSCGTGGTSNSWLGRLFLVRWVDNAPVDVVAYVDDQCVSDAGSPLGHKDVLLTPPQLGWDSDQMMFDEESGSLLLVLREACIAPDSSLCNYDEGGWLVAIDGFATTFEILQSYTPATATINFRVPYMPEGFQSADFFDTYHGDLATVGDWSQAQPLQCGFPATAPAVGDYFEVPGLPEPASGEGVYWITAATYQGATRYGRQSNGGVLTGRDPGLLPGCE